MGKMTVTLVILYSCPRSTDHHGNASLSSVHECVLKSPSTANLAGRSSSDWIVSLLTDRQSSAKRAYNNPVTMKLFLIVVYFKTFLYHAELLCPPSERSETGGHTVFTFVRMSVCPWALIFRCKYLQKGLRWRLGTNYPLIGNGLWRIEWWHHRWRQVTFSGQGVDPNIVKARYFE